MSAQMWFLGHGAVVCRWVGLAEEEKQPVLAKGKGLIGMTDEDRWGRVPRGDGLV
jgi:hypothetical protein